MSLRVNYNPSSVRTHQHLVSADRLLSRSLERLSSGERINRSSDDPSGLVSANTIRYNLAGIVRASQNIEEGISMLQSADGAMDGISSLLTRLRSLALAAANEGANDATQFTALQNEFDEAVSSITRIAEQSSYGNIPLLQGQLADITLPSATKASYTAVAWDSTRLPGGLQAGSTLTIAAPDTTRSQVTAKFFGNPPLGTAIQGLNQNGTVLDDVAGKTVTVTGPSGGPQVYTLAAGTTLGEFVARVNANTIATGVRAGYNTATGELSVATVGPGTVTLASQDMTLTGTTSVGFLDSDASAAANPLQSATGDLLRERFEVTLSSAAVAAQPFPDRDTPLNALYQNGTQLAVAGGEQVTVSGPRGSSVITLPANATIGDFVDLVNLQTNSTGVRAAYDSASGSLAVENTAFGSGTLNVASSDLSGGGNIGLLDTDTTSAANPFRSPVDTFSVNLTKPGTGGAITTADLVQGLAQNIGGPAGSPFAAVDGKEFTIFGNGSSASLTLQSTKTAADVAAHLASISGGTWDATTGSLTVDGFTTTVGAGTSWHSLADWATTTTTWTVSVSGSTVTSSNGGPADSFSLDGTTIQDVLDFVNQHTSELGTRASFAAGTLSITGTKGPISLSSEDLTGTSANEGLLDRNVLDTLDTGGTKTVSSWNATLDLTYTDALGVSRTIPLSQMPSQGDGLTFTNLNAGPQAGPPWTLWEAGAFTITVRDSSKGVMGLVATAATSDATAVRQSTTWMQTGGLASQRVNVDIPDLRAGALGRSALLAELAGTSGTGTLLSEKGYDSLDDLVSGRALVNGDAQLALSVIDAAIQEVSGARGETGALQANSLESSLSSLRVAIENLTDSESRIRDTDFAKESAEFARNNVIYQAATAMLAQANQVPQTVLQLLR